MFIQVKFVDDRFPKDDGKILVTCIGISSGIGRLISGPISDYKGINRIVMQQVYWIIHLNGVFKRFGNGHEINCD